MGTGSALTFPVPVMLTVVKLVNGLDRASVRSSICSTISSTAARDSSCSRPEQSDTEEEQEDEAARRRLTRLPSRAGGSPRGSGRR